MDAIAVGQFTPGPVFSSVTFIGWQLNGPCGAVVATVAVTVCIEFGRETVTGWKTILIAILSFIVTFGFRRVNSAWVILGGGLLGYLLTLVT